MKRRRLQNNVEYHSFFCLNCGQFIYELPRSLYKPPGKGHLKKLYCPHCKEKYNAYECRNEIEAYDFKVNYAEGKFKRAISETQTHNKEEKEFYDKFNNVSRSSR